MKTLLAIALVICATLTIKSMMLSVDVDELQKARKRDLEAFLKLQACVSQLQDFELNRIRISKARDEFDTQMSLERARIMKEVFAK